MNTAAFFAFIVAVVLFVVLLWKISRHRKAAAAHQWVVIADQQFKRLENVAVDVATMIGDVEFEQVAQPEPGQYDIWFKIRIRRTNKTERFNLYINLDSLLPLNDDSLDREMTREVQKKSTEILSRATGTLRTYQK